MCILALPCLLLHVLLENGNDTGKGPVRLGGGTRSELRSKKPPPPPSRAQLRCVENRRTARLKKRSLFEPRRAPLRTSTERKTARSHRWPFRAVVLQERKNGTETPAGPGPPSLGWVSTTVGSKAASNVGYFWNQFQILGVGIGFGREDRHERRRHGGPFKKRNRYRCPVPKPRRYFATSQVRLSVTDPAYFGAMSPTS